MEQPILIHNGVYKDHRGTFAPLPLIFDENKLPVLRKSWRQSNVSFNNKKWTFRGMHYQDGEYAQAKLVKVINGAILDFFIDLRPDSLTFGHCKFEEVKPNYELYVPRGFAHGFITTEDNTVVQYLVDNRYFPDSEGSILWSSVPYILKTIEEYIVDFDKNKIIISDKDNVCQTLEEYLNNYGVKK